MAVLATNTLTTPIILNSGTLTASAPILNLSQTWNNAAVTFTGLKFNATDTASQANSLLLDIQRNGVSSVSVNQYGVLNVAGSIIGSSAIRSTTNAGVFSLGFSSDVILARDAANVLALRNGSAAQAFNVYNTYTDASNYEQLQIGAGIPGLEVNTFGLVVRAVGTGATNKPLYFGTIGDGQIGFITSGSTRWLISPLGHFITNADNAYDIGASGANRPRNVFIAGSGTFGGNVAMGSAGLVVWSGRGSIGTSADGAFVHANAAGTNSFTITAGASNLATFNGGITAGGTITAGASSRIGWVGVSQIYGGATNGNIVLSNAAATDFGLLQFGGTTSSFPALKRNGVGLQVRLADDSAYTLIRSSQHYFNNGSFIDDTSDGVFRFGNNAASNTVTMTAGASGLASFGGTIAVNGVVQTGGYVRWGSAGATGIAQIADAAATGFNRLILGTNDTSGVSIVKNGTQFDFKTGDSSAYVNVIANAFIATAAGSGLILGSNGRFNTTGDGVFQFSNNAVTNSATMTVGASNLLTLNGGLTTGGSVTSGNAFVLASGGAINWLTRARLTSPADGISMFINNALTDFGRLILGTNDASGVSLVKNGTTIYFRNGNNTADASLVSYGLLTTGPVTASTFVKTAAKTFATLTAAATAGAGARSFITDALTPTFGSAAVGGGAVPSPVYSDGTNWLIG